MSRASIVIPLYQRADLTLGCLEALERTGTLVDAEVVLVDNASTDGTPELCAAWADRVTVVRNDVNRGFAIACNQGVRAASGDVVVLLNNDTVVHDGWLEPLVAAVADPRVGVAGSRLVYPGGRVQHAGMALAPGCVPVHIHRYLPGDHPVVSRSRDLAIVTGACLAIRRDLYLQSGGLDEGYRNGFEDTDLCLRLASQGLVARYCGDSVVTHLESMSPGRLDHDHLNGARFRRRWREFRPDLEGLLAADGFADLRPPRTMWRGPLFDGSSHAAFGRDRVADLEDRGLRPAVIEIPLGDAAPGLDVPHAVVAAVNRLYLSRGVTRVFHHTVPGQGTPAPVAGAHLVVVDGAGVGAVAAADTVVAADPYVADASDAALGTMTDVPEGVGYWGPALGDGRHAVAARALLRAVADGGRPVRLVPTDTTVALDAPALPPLGPQDFVPGVWVACGAPRGSSGAPGWESATMTAGGRLAAWCWVDAEGIPASWWEASRWADELWVPSASTAAAFAAAGWEGGVRVVPPPIDTALFRPQDPPPADPVTLLAVLDWSWLGGWDLLVRAFVEEFTPDDPVRLRLVVRSATGANPTGDVLSLLSSLGRDPESIADLELIPTPPTDADLADALHAAHALVHPVRGEGLGRELLAAMATGVPVIATAAGAQTELLAGGAGAAVPVVRRMPVGPAQAGGDPDVVGLGAAEPSPDVLRRAMRGVVANPGMWRERAEPLVREVRALAGAEVVARLVSDRLDHLLARGRSRTGG